MIIRLVVGALLIGIGYLIGHYKRIDLVHSYHIHNIREEDKDIFCAVEGFGNAVTGIGVVIGSMTVMFAGIIISLYAVKKYNGSFF